MGRDSDPDKGNRNFDSISPSARSLLLMKGLTNIPFARAAAELLKAPEPYHSDFDNSDAGWWARVLHFEMRYWSVDQLLEGLTARNYLELSSGYSFRGLDMMIHEGVCYIDTDLVSIIDTKKRMIRSLRPVDTARKATLEFAPLNALDESSFLELVDRFPDGEVVIINEGLLMYLDEEEKKKLCTNVRKALERRGGYWITADIYVRKKDDGFDSSVSSTTKQFFARHRMEENKFESFEEAKRFFRAEGFLVDKEAQTDRSKLSTLEYLMNAASPSQLKSIRSRGTIQATWRLRLASGKKSEC